MIDISYSLSDTQIILLSVLVIWDLVWKLLAAWKAAKNKHKIAFIFILIINSVGIIPILYLAYDKYKKSDKKISK